MPFLVLLQGFQVWELQFLRETVLWRVAINTAAECPSITALDLLLTVTVGRNTQLSGGAGRGQGDLV